MSITDHVITSDHVQHMHTLVRAPLYYAAFALKFQYSLNDREPMNVMGEEFREVFEQFIARQTEKPSNSFYSREKIDAITNYLEGGEYSYNHGRFVSSVMHGVLNDAL